MKFQCYTLGCKVNQYETQALERQLLALGHEQADRDCDLLIVNTCTVTAVADRKNRTLIRRLRRENPNAVLGVCGCYAQLKSDEVRALDVDVIGGSGDREAFLQNLLHAARERAPIVAVDEALRRREFEELPAGGLAARTRAMLKVQDGCCNFCTYCIIPYARGPVRSAPLETAVTQAAQLAAEGYREIVLTGIEISSWGRDLKNGKSLIDLLEAICAAVPGVRVRLGSLEPRTITEEFCRRAAALPNLCPQFHLSMQSGCDATLKRMNRKYDTARFYESVELLNRFFDRPAVTTDLITGFPEETEEEFAQTLDFIRRCGFAQMHIFPYSVRPGTPAAKMRQNPKAVKEERAHRAAAVAAEMHRAYLEGCVGRVYPVLFEQPKNGRFSGHAPNYMEVLADGENLHNIVQNIQIIGIDGDALLGELLEEGDGTPV